MAMQESAKGANGTAPNPALSDDQAEQFAASFTPAWDVDDGLGDTTDGTADATLRDATVRHVAEHAPAPADPPFAGPAVNPLSKQTMIGVPPPGMLAGMLGTAGPAPARPALSSTEAIEPENVLEVLSATPAHAAQPPPAPHVKAGMRTQVMEHRPAPAPAAPVARNGGGAAPPAPRAAVAADPFRASQVARARGPSSADDLDVVPKRSSKTIVVIVTGLALVAGVGLFLKFGMADSASKTETTQLVTGPAVPTADIPPPPPKVEPPTPSTAAVTAAKTAEPPAAPLAIPPPRVAVEPTPRVAAPAGPRNEPRQPRGAAPPPAQAATPPPAGPAASPKTAPKAPNGGIVRDNPF